MNSGLEAIRKSEKTHGYSQWNNSFLFFPFPLTAVSLSGSRGGCWSLYGQKEATSLNESLQGLMPAFGFNTLLKGTLAVPWHFPIIWEPLLSFSRTGARTVNLLPSLCLISILLLLLSFILFYNQLFTLHKVNFLTNLTLPCWRSLGCKKMTIKSQTNLHLSKVSWFLQFHTGAVSLHSNNTRKTANIATFQMAARLLNNDWLWKLRMNVGTTLYRKSLWDGVWKCL